MRRSKALPSKTVRSYRKVSQRRMTEHDDQDDDPAEIERLKLVLAQTQAVLEHSSSSSQQQHENKKKKQEPNDDKDNKKNPNQDTNDAYGGGEDDLVLLPNKKKNKPSKSVAVELTPEEIREAKLLQKQTQKKLKQLQDRKTQKETRAHLYQKLQQSAISKQTLALLQPSATLGQTPHKKLYLRQLLQKERAGLTLTQQERNVLYSEQEQPPPLTIHEGNNNNHNKEPDTKQSKSFVSSESPSTSVMTITTTTDDKKRKLSSSSQNNKKKKQADRDDDEHKETSSVKQVQSPPAVSREKDTKKETAPDNEIKDMEVDSTAESAAETKEHNSENDRKKINQSDPPATTDKPALSFAAQMMASLSALKTSSVTQAAHVAEEKKEQQQKQRAQAEAELETEFAHVKSYVPSKPIPLLTAAALGLKPSHSDDAKHRRVVSLPNRPAKIQVARYDLPVAAMEFEVMDTIRNNDVTIICGETGSGKSTQVPQFLYEAGCTLSPSSSNNNNENNESHYMVGITQPRRVAAVSTAKRVCYEMGHGDGQTIRNQPSTAANNNNNNTKRNGNLVAYQTRYEVAGLGDATHIKFMTDGILLQEIQSDLLLRKYSVILIDEAHERNLNSDALVGLLSAALPLRKQAAEESNGTLIPLKLVIMSATLRVTDFTDNPRLFAHPPPAVLKIPGRTFSVTVHHSKSTEIERYEDEAYKKICKIHKKLPPGGILVFLTGKQEIVRMVRRLRKSLGSTTAACREVDARDVQIPDDAADQDFLRDMDDDEVDGEFFVDAAAEGGDDDNEPDQEKLNEDKAEKDDAADSSPTEGSNIPEKAVILPLYSMLSAEEQARVFQPVPEGHRLIVIATNIAETSITIPDISYVVDTGRQKCRNYNAKTGVASYDIMWISKAAADQRAGRAGRTGPGHCYRLYSNSMYARHMDDFALPEVLTRPLEDVVLAMKAMNITNVADFPFPTPPGQDQLLAAVELLANLGCVDISKVEENGGDGVVTRLGAAVAKLPLGVRYGKMLLVAAEAGVLDYAIAMVAVMSEVSPFVVHGQQIGNDGEESKKEDGVENSDSSDDEEKQEAQKKKSKNRWVHRGGDILAGVLAVGAYTYAGRGAGGMSEKVACRKFCEANGLHPVIMARIQKMRVHLARLAKTRLSSAEGFASKTGGILSSMKPPNKVQEQLLSQAIASGLLDNVAMLAPLGSIPGEYSFSLRSAYLGCSSSLTEPLLMDRNSVVYSRDPRQLPKWICYDSVIRKTTKDGTPVASLRGITPIDPSWLGSLAKGSRLLKLGEPLANPVPCYDAEKDVILCSVKTKFGNQGWEISPVQVEMFDVLQSAEAKSSSHFLSDDSFRWFARYLLEGKVLGEFQALSDMLSDSAALITRRTPTSKVGLLVSELAGSGVDSAAALRKHWAEHNSKFLYAQVQKWIRPDSMSHFKSLWKETVTREIKLWKNRAR